MSKQIEAAIEALTKKATDAGDSADALRFTQAALNLYHIESAKESFRLEERRIAADELRIDAADRACFTRRLDSNPTSE